MEMEVCNLKYLFLFFLISLCYANAEIDIWLVAGTDSDRFPDDLPAAYTFLNNSPNTFIYWDNSEEYNIYYPNARDKWPDDYTQVNNAYKTLFNRQENPDLVILNGINRSFWDESQWTALKNWVLNGGNLITLGSWASYGGQDVVYFESGESYELNLGNWDKTPFNDTLPVKIFKNPDSVERYPIGDSYSPPTKIFKEKDDPIFENIEWNNPYVCGYHLLAPKSNSTTLAYFDDGSPAIIKRKYGSGNVLSLAFGIDKGWGGINGSDYNTSDYFRWWYYSEQFLYNCVTSTCQQEPIYSKLEVTSIDYPSSVKLGDTAKIDITIKNTGNYTIKKVRLSFLFPEEIFENISDFDIILGDIEPQKSTTYSLLLNCTKEGQTSFIFKTNGIYSEEIHNTTTLSIYKERDSFFNLEGIIGLSIFSFGCVISAITIKKGKIFVKGINCQNCGKKIVKPNSEYCQKCGAETAKLCPACKEYIPIAAIHCKYCGKKQKLPEDKKKEKKIKEKKKKTPKKEVKPLIIEDGKDITKETYKEDQKKKPKTEKKKKTKKKAKTKGAKKTEKDVENLFS